MGGFSVKTNTGDTAGVQVACGIPWLARVYCSVEFDQYHDWLGRKFANWLGSLGELDVLSIKMFDDAVWWEILHPSHHWYSNTPRWRSGNFRPFDFLLGKQQYRRTILSVHDVVIPMPEGPYPAVIKMCRDTWTHSRLSWPCTVVLRADIEMKTPIPHAGKGENSWDCGTQTTHGLCTPAETVDQAIAAMVETALHARRRYDGNIMAQYPAPGATP
ncbi:MAG: hypothetical protein WC505_05945 [Patescibacteria group bacterium]